MFEWLRKAFTRKASAVGPILEGVGYPGATWPRYDARLFAEEGVLSNWVINTCVTRIVDGVGSIPMVVQDAKGNELDANQPGNAASLLANPSPGKSGRDLVRALTLHILTAGQCFVEAVPRASRAGALGWGSQQLPVQLFALRPDRMVVVPGPRGFPLAFEFGEMPDTVSFPVDQVTGVSRILQVKREHPIDDFNGMGFLQPVARVTELLDQLLLTRHNLAKAGAKRGILMLEDVSENEIGYIRQRMDRASEAANLAGEIMVMTGRASWLDVGVGAPDVGMDETMRDLARAICNVFGVPPPLVLAGESTYSNREQARQELYEHAVVPLFEHLTVAMARWLSALSGERITIAPNLDGVPALAGPRSAQRAAVVAEWQAGLIKLDEARAALGYEPLGGEKGEMLSIDGAPAEPEEETAAPSGKAA